MVPGKEDVEMDRSARHDYKDGRKVEVQFHVQDRKKSIEDESEV